MKAPQKIRATKFCFSQEIFCGKVQPLDLKYTDSDIYAKEKEDNRSMSPKLLSGFFLEPQPRLDLDGCGRKYRRHRRAGLSVLPQPISRSFPCLEHRRPGSLVFPGVDEKMGIRLVPRPRITWAMASLPTLACVLQNTQSISCHPSHWS